MRKLLILTLISLPSFADTSYWLGMETGKFFIEDGAKEESSAGTHFGLKGFVSKEAPKWIFDAGIGMGTHSLETSYSSGEYVSGDFQSNYYLLNLAQRFKLNERWSLGLETNIAIGNKLRVGLNEYQMVMTGPGITYHKDLTGDIEARIGGSLQQGLNFNRQTRLLTLNIQFGFRPQGKDLPEVIIKSNSLTKNSPENIHQTVGEYAPYGFELSEKVKTGLLALSSILKDHPFHQIIIEGHADESGDYKINEPLSLKRAQVVADLLEKQGVPKEKMIAEGKGAWEPLVVPGDTVEAKAMNRRVVIKVYFK